MSHSPCKSNSSEYCERKCDAQVTFCFKVVTNSDELKRKLEGKLKHDPAAVLLGIYPKELKPDVYTEACTEDVRDRTYSE